MQTETWSLNSQGDKQQSECGTGRIKDGVLGTGRGIQGRLLGSESLQGLSICFLSIIMGMCRGMSVSPSM